MTTSELELNFGKPVPKAEPATYQALCTGVETFVINEGTAEAKTLLRWDFSLDGVEDPELPGFNVILDGVTSLATGPRSKMRPWVTALIGRELDEAFSLSALRKLCVSKACLVRVEINEAGYSKVADVLPPMRQPAKPPTATTDQPMTALPNQVAGEFTGAPTQPPAIDKAGDLPF